MTATKTKPKPPRKPAQVWEDVHKHPAGVPGGMGLSPEHHLRNRGWSGHEINESAGRKTIQYRNQRYPDFSISYGGATSQKPDHNFRVLYMGTNSNVPKVHHSYSLADAMNKVEELHRLQSGLVVQPLTAVQAATSVVPKPPTSAGQDNISQEKTFVAPDPVSAPSMKDPNDFPIGPPKVEFPTQPDREKDWPKKVKPQVKEIPDAPDYSSQTPPKYAAHGTLGGFGQHRDAGETSCPLCAKAEYGRQRRTAVQRQQDVKLASLARRLGMDIKPEEVAGYRGLRSVVAAFQRAEQETWEA